MNALKREAAALLDTIPDYNLEALIPYLKFLQGELQQESPQKNSTLQRKRAAFQAILDMKEKSPFFIDFDYEKAREEAMIEKYGRFD